MGQGLRVVHQRDGRSKARVRKARWTPTATTMMAIALIALRELACLIPDDDLAWRIHLTSNELLLAALSLLMPQRWLGAGLCAVFITQAIDEVLDGNLFNDGIWEYPAAALILFISWMTQRKR